ncbi:MAG: ABC transporter permease [Clostridiales bacterium]|jgi:spermidine/putrescine transport system permease protein|nr:ABC transporter permease [Clostridiales bacterium]
MGILSIVKKIYLILIFLFLYLPILVLILFSFSSSRTRGVFEGFTLRWYIELFKDKEVLNVLLKTLLIAVSSSFIATVLGVIFALCLYKSKGFLKKFLLNTTRLPLINPDIITGISLMILFMFAFKYLKFLSINLNFGFLTILISHTVFNIPYVIFAILPRLSNLDENIFEAAYDLGANHFVMFKDIMLPEIFPGIVSGALLSSAMSLDDFIISFFTSGSSLNNLSILIYSMTRRGINPKINALSSIIFLLLLISIYFINIDDETILESTSD